MARLNGHIQDKELIAEFAKSNIVVHFYSKCFTDMPDEQGLIFGYSSVRGPVIKQKLLQMAAIFQHLHK